VRFRPRVPTATFFFAGRGPVSATKSRGKGRAPEISAGAARRRSAFGPHKEFPMLGTILIILLVLWLLGVVSSYTLGGFIHILLVIAVVIVVIRLASGQRIF
jgi:hypothetical protein